MMHVAPVLCLSLALLQPLATLEPRRLRIDASEVPEAEDARMEIEQAVLAALNEQGISRDAVRIKIIWLDANDLVVGIYASVDPEIDPLDARVVKCPEVSGAFCTPKKLPGYVRRAVERAIADRKLTNASEVIPPETGAIEPTPKTVTPETTDPTPPAPSPNPSSDATSNGKVGGSSPPPRSAMTKAGIPLVAVGIAALGTGTALAIVEHTRPVEDKSLHLPTRPTGYVLLGAGGALLATGIALWVVGRTRTKRAVAVFPSVQPGRAFFALEGRF